MSQLKGNFVPVLSFSVFLVVNFHKHVHCSYEHPKPDELERGVHIEAPHLVKKRSIDQPLRISTIFDESIDGLEGEKYKLVYDKLLPEAISFWEKALKVRKPVRPMKLNRQCPTRQVFLREGKSYCVDKCNPVTICGEILVPDHHLNPCYVCNSKGDNCRELPEESLQETTSTTESNAISENATVIPGSEDEVEDSKGIEDDDFFLYITAEETQRCNSDIIAYAVHCQQESSLDRPIAGHANFCPSGLSTKSFDYSLQLSSVKHEILHALGFSDLLFAFYRDENGEPLTERLADTGYPPYDEKLRVHKWSDRVVKNITRKNWMVRGGSIERSFQMVVTPRVVKEVREHFNCSDLEGAELEDQGGEGTALTHWEKRIFENEAMSGTQTQTSVFSRITFAMMEDTGWYRADYSHAAPLDWGRGLGCKFAMTSCKQWLNTQSREKAKPFCEKIKKIPAETDCSSNRLGVVLCNLVRHDTELPKVYQHFDLLPHVASGEEAHYGGSVSLADYCPYLQEFDWKQSALTTRRSTCTDESNKPDPNNNFALEDFGPHSRCFKNSGRAWQQQSCETILKRGNTGSSCYKYKCHSGRLHIEIGNYTYPCYYAGQKLKIQIRNGKWLHKGGGIICPPCSELCAQEFALRNEYCKADEKEIPNNLYPNDALNCSGVIGTPTVMPSRGVAIVTPAITLIAAILCAV